MLVSEPHDRKSSLPSARKGSRKLLWSVMPAAPILLPVQIHGSRARLDELVGTLQRVRNFAASH